MQGGQLLHVLNGEMQLRPRRYGSPPSSDDGVQNTDGKAQGMDKMEEVMDQINELATHPVPLRLSNMDRERIEEEAFAPMVRRTRSAHVHAKKDNIQPFDTDYSLRSDQRVSMNKFEPLRFNGMSFTEAAIGGYQIDVGKVREKVEKYVPLPPAVLPKVFIDPELNFLHNFMQGLEMLAGRDYITRIMAQGTYTDTDKGKILPILNSLTESGYKEGDTELNVFVKRVLCSTFDTVPDTTGSRNQKSMIVAANLWGFLYIEPGMTCKESEIKMWLHMTYTQYRMAWFNSFKSSGVPSFASEGVQDRYTSSTYVSDRKPKSALRIDDYSMKHTDSHGEIRRSDRSSRDVKVSRGREYPQPARKPSIWEKLTN